jgi:hypothetical protein
MTTIETVVKTWDENHPSRQIEIHPHLPIGKNGIDLGGKVAWGTSFEKVNKWAVIRLSPEIPPFDVNATSYEKLYYSHLCYEFDFLSSGIPKIGFYIRKNAPCDIISLEKVLKSFDGQLVISGRTLRFKDAGHGTLMLRIEFGKNETNLPAQYICDCMEKFIELTQKSICNILGKKLPHTEKKTVVFKNHVSPTWRG